MNGGRSALIEWARLHAACVRLLSPGRALILADAGANRARLWQLVRVEAPLRESLGEAGVGSPQQVVMSLAFATMQLIRARDTLRSARIRLPCTLWTVGSDAMRQPIFVGLMPDVSEPAEPEEPVAALIQRELGPVLVRLRRDRADYADVVERLFKTSKTSDVEGLRALADVAASTDLSAA